MAPQHTFGKPYRLLKTDEFSSVFTTRRPKKMGCLQVFCAVNNKGHARLGLVVSKKVAKRAVKRNYMKRYLREWFRQHRALLEPSDCIVRVRYAFSRGEHRSVDEALRALLKPGAKKATSP